LFSLSSQLHAEQFEGKCTLPEEWVHRLFTSAVNLSDTGEVNLDLFVTVVQGTVIDTAQSSRPSWSRLTTARIHAV
jgi:hypothetical protein